MQRTSVAPEKIRELISPFLAAKGLVAWGVELAASGHRQLVRLYLDLADDVPRTPERRGVTIDECATVSRHLGSLLEMEDIFHGPYVLEVSSPGLGRRFFTAGQLPAYIGETIEAKLAAPRDGRKRFRGKLTAVAGVRVTMTVDSVPQAFSLSFDFDEADKVRLIHAFDAISEGEATEGDA
ncbi:ribosome maturation factor RimP [Solidesulfovibrio sp. C21]|uniref:ribosome maturation factor RimP n=1 Tax=Solidesulfovibrio sp. C21 TaxID=3398613 RepID=UPI0039FBE09F